MGTVNVIKVAEHRRTLNFWERIYVVEVLKGLWITNAHLIRNFWNHSLQFVGLKPKDPGAVTYQFPEVHPPLPPRIRTMHRLARRPDGSPRCVACMMCETVCPALCIRIVAEEDPDVHIEKRPRSFDIDLGRCVFCGYCVEACPEDAIRMDTGIIAFGSDDRGRMVLNMETLLSLEPATETSPEERFGYRERFVAR